MKVSNDNPVIDSPIEMLMINAIDDKANELMEKDNNWEIHINPQWTFKVDGNNYKVDIGLQIIYMTEKKYNSFSQSYFIECDGYDYHYRNKKQVTKDRKRERKLMKRCRNLIRFTGTEIYNDVENCVEELFDIIKKDISCVTPPVHDTGVYDN